VEAISSSASNCSNSGDSSTLRRSQTAIHSSGNAARNGSRHPHDSKLSLGSRATARKAPDDSRVPIGEPICGIAA
jgi:hypothetical protein